MQKGLVQRNPDSRERVECVLIEDGGATVVVELPDGLQLSVPADRFLATL